MLAPDIQIHAEFWPAHAELFVELRDTVDWDTRMKARQTASYGAPYDYSQLTYPSRAMHPALVPTLLAVRETVGFEPDNCLLNHYVDGESSMGFHADAREDLEPDTGVVILSLGSPRSLVFRRKQARDHVVEFRLQPGSLVLMPDSMQDEWQHAIPREPGAGPRISVTFRKLRASVGGALLLGCVQTVSLEPPPAEEAPSERSTPPVELEPPAAAAPPIEAEPIVASEPREEPASEGGHVIRPSDPVPQPGTIPTVEVSKPMVGTMDKDVIRRIVRAHMHEIRECYNLGLAKDPALAGKIAIEFTIGPSGKVERSVAKDLSGLADPEVPKCIAEAIATWTFPEPRSGGRVTVSYPFNLVPG